MAKHNKVGLTLEDVALLIDGVGGVPDETLHRLSPFLRSDPRLTAQVQELETLAQDAGIDPHVCARFQTGLEAHQDFRRLLETDGWDNPAAILDPDGDAGVYFRELVHIATAHASSKDAGGGAQEIKERLERAYATELADTALVEGFVKNLLERDPGKGEQLLRLLESQYRIRRKQQSEDSASD